MTVYWSEMENLKKSHPAAYSELKRGSFAVQRSDNAFAQVAVDNAIEQTINRDSKTHGGIIGFSLRPSAVQRWIVTAHVRAAIAQVCRQLTGLDGSFPHHREGLPSAMKHQEEAIARVVSLLKS